MTIDVFNSPAVALLVALEQRSVRVSLTEGGRLVAEPASRLTAEEQTTFRACAREVAIVLRSIDAGVLERRSVFQKQLAAVEPPALPAFLFRADVPYQAGLCFSCGGALTA